jgi:hypothetical protein
MHKVFETVHQLELPVSKVDGQPLFFGINSSEANSLLDYTITPFVGEVGRRVSLHRI